MSKKSRESFQFDTSFQQEVLHYLIIDKYGSLSLDKIKDTYFTLIEHQVVAKCLRKFYKISKRIPGEAVLLNLINDMVHSKSYSGLFVQEDVINLKILISKLYKPDLLDADIIKEKIHQFATYIEVKSLQEEFDLSDFSQYEGYHNKLTKLLNKNSTDDRDKPKYLVADLMYRQFQRQAEPIVIPTPIRQFNALLNGGGLPKYAIITFLDESKATKTFHLVNIARKYLSQKKVVLYLDTENGEMEITTRMEQSTMGITKSELLSGDFDKKEQKHLRKYKRLGSEFIVRHIPANIGTSDDVEKIIDEIYNTTGLTVNIIIADFLGKFGSTTKAKDDFERVSQAYIDMKNLLVKRNIESCWTAQHVKRDAKERRETRYQEGDIAKCIDIPRHVNVIIGLNGTDEEKENGVQRWEIVVNRDGPPFGRCLFKIDLARQRATEFTRDQRIKYDKELAPEIEEKIKNQEIGSNNGGMRKRLKNPIADQAKANKKRGGDI